MFGGPRRSIIQTVSSAVIAAQPQRLRAFVTTVAVLGGLALVGACAAIASAPPSLGTLTGAIVLLGLAGAAEWAAVAEPEFNVSLAAAFMICVALLYGPAIAAVGSFAFAASAVSLRQLLIDRALFNLANLTISGLGAGACVQLVGTDTDSRTVLAAFLATATYFTTNYLLVSMAVSREQGTELRAEVVRLARWGVLPIALSFSVAPLFVIEWHRSPLIALMAITPLLAVGLRLRSVEESRASARSLALSDPLTGLGNRRHFMERLKGALDKADRTGASVSLCLFDLDRFKLVNDTFGHEAGDDVLVAVAFSLRQGGEAFRLGGDEFALLLGDTDAHKAREIAVAVQSRVGAIELPDRAITATFGIASYSIEMGSRDVLLREADTQLYRNKRSLTASTD